jgi:hypothetical protein
MNPFVQQVVGAVARAAVIWIGAKIGMELSADEATKVVVTYIIPAAMLAWSLWQKYSAQQKLVTAAASGKSMSQAQVEQQIASGGGASVLTPKHEVPQ